MEVRPVPGLEHEPYAEVWLAAVDDAVLDEAFAAAARIGKPGLEIGTTTKTPAVEPFLLDRGFSPHRRYVISELDVKTAPDPGEPGTPLVTVAERPDLGPALNELARVAHADQPGRAGTDIGGDWLEWGFHAHPPESYFVALDGDRVLAYGYLEPKDGVWWHGFLAVAREARGRGLAGAIKRAQIRFAKEHGIASLRTATETRLEGMRDLNRRLGYRPLYEEIVVRGTR
jgi:GNAT superfamily N-acetyltransferase